MGTRVSDDFICKVASTVEEVKELVDVGFEYVSEINGSHLYRNDKAGAGFSKKRARWDSLSILSGFPAREWKKRGIIKKI